MIGLLLLLAAIAADSEAERKLGHSRQWRGPTGPVRVIGSYEGRIISLAIELVGYPNAVRSTRRYSLRLRWKGSEVPLYLGRAGRQVPVDTAKRWLDKIESDPIARQQLCAMIVIYAETGSIPDDADWTKIPVVEALEANQVPDWRPDVPIPEDADALG